MFFLHSLQEKQYSSSKNNIHNNNFTAFLQTRSSLSGENRKSSVRLLFRLQLVIHVRGKTNFARLVADCGSYLLLISVS